MLDPEHIDRLIFKYSSSNWKKVASIVVSVITDESLDERVLEEKDVESVRGRIAEMVVEGFYESRGDLSAMGYSEVRLISHET